MCQNESYEACRKYFMRICGTTNAENVLLKPITFLCRMPVASIKMLSCLLQSMCCIMFLQKVSFSCSFTTFLMIIVAGTLNFVLIVECLHEMHSLETVSCHH